MLKQNFPEFYEITDKMFTVYKRTYTSDVGGEETALLRKNVENVFKNASIQIPNDEEIRKTAEKVSKK